MFTGKEKGKEQGFATWSVLRGQGYAVKERRANRHCHSQAEALVSGDEALRGTGCPEKSRESFVAREQSGEGILGDVRLAQLLPGRT